MPKDLHLLNDNLRLLCSIIGVDRSIIDVNKLQKKDDWRWASKDTHIHTHADLTQIRGVGAQLTLPPKSGLCLLSFLLLHLFFLYIYIYILMQSVNVNNDLPKPKNNRVVSGLVEPAATPLLPNAKPEKSPYPWVINFTLGQKINAPPSAAGWKSWSISTLSLSHQCIHQPLLRQTISSGWGDFCAFLFLIESYISSTKRQQLKFKYIRFFFLSRVLYISLYLWNEQILL